MCQNCDLKTLEDQRSWLQIKLPDSLNQQASRFKSDSVAQLGTCNCKGSRVWTKHPLPDLGMSGITVPSSVGGTIIFEDSDGLFTVRWDNKRITLHQGEHFNSSVYRIGNSATLADYRLRKQKQPNA